MARTPACEDPISGARQVEIRKERDDLMFRCSCETLIGARGEKVLIQSHSCEVHRGQAADAAMGFMVPVPREWWSDPT